MIARNLLTLSLLAGPALAEAPVVVTDIAPVYALTAQVMQGVGDPVLLVDPGASPHGYALRPSKARALNDADLIVWVGHALTPWLEKPIDALGHDAMLELLDLPETHQLQQRGGVSFAEHAHGDHDDHGHDKDDHDDHGGTDPHAWLDPRNGAAWLEAIAAELSRIDPENAATYAANAQAGVAQLTRLEAEIRQMLPAAPSGFVVFHDAYHHFEYRFGLSAAGAISLSDATAPSAGRIAALKESLGEMNVSCAFTEPQFNSAILSALDAEGLRVSVLDPLGADVPLGPDHYAQTLRQMATAFAKCTVPAS